MRRIKNDGKLHVIEETIYRPCMFLNKKCTRRFPHESKFCEIPETESWAQDMYKRCEYYGKDKDSE